MDLKELDTPWAIIIYRHHKGKRIEKDDVIAALESDAPVPDYAKPLLSEIISGKYCFIRGLKPDTRFDLNVSRWALASLVDAIEAEIIKERANEKSDKLRGTITPREEAKELVSKAYGMSVRKLEKIMKKKKTGAQ